MRICLLLFLAMITSKLLSQPIDNPVEYMNYLNERENNLSINYLSYMSEVAHGERVRKMEKKRVVLINAIKEAIKDGTRLRAFKGDIALRDAYVSYWNIVLSVFNEDYHKIIDMEEVAEQSYDAMEAYILAQKKVDEKLEEAYKKIPVAYNAFASKNNVLIPEAQSTKLSKKLNQTAAVSAYFNVIYLIFFKAYMQEMNVLKAFEVNDLNGIEQSKGSLLKYAEEGLLKLDTIKPYKNDGSAITATRKVLEFYKSEATKDIPIQSDFLMKKIEYDKITKSFEMKPAAKRTQDDIEAYNRAVNEYNKSAANVNKTINNVNVTRTAVLNNWNTSKKRFMDLHIPYK